MRHLPYVLLISITAIVPGSVVTGQQASVVAGGASAEFCPVDRRDGPLYEHGRAYYGITAERIVRRFLSPPHDSWEREVTGTQHLDASGLRILVDGTDDEACRRLTLVVSNGTRNSPPPSNWVYFTAGGFYFLSEWKRAQVLSNYTTSYTHVIVYDAEFRLLEAFAF